PTAIQLSNAPRREHLAAYFHPIFKTHFLSPNPTLRRRKVTNPFTQSDRGPSRANHESITAAPAPASFSRPAIFLV
ncbi:MAG TPA: hypothetical protein VEA63_12305, partial [Opitutus sp.]|nr:hypothetical protein [Opitutus sp.]